MSYDIYNKTVNSSWTFRTTPQAQKFGVTVRFPYEVGKTPTKISPAQDL